MHWTPYLAFTACSIEAALLPDAQMMKMWPNFCSYLAFHSARFCSHSTDLKAASSLMVLMKIRSWGWNRSDQIKEAYQFVFHLLP